jgi:cytochrome c
MTRSSLSRIRRADSTRTALLAAATMLAAAVMVAASPSWAAGDPVTAGRDLFAHRCAACHGLSPTRKPGPTLAGVYGRRAGSVATYHYSAALKGATLTWNAETLDRWLSGPPAFIPGVNMQAQVDSEQDRQDLIAYLKSLSAPTASQSAAPSGG